MYLLPVFYILFDYNLFDCVIYIVFCSEEFDVIPCPYVLVYFKNKHLALSTGLVQKLYPTIYASLFERRNGASFAGLLA